MRDDASYTGGMSILIDDPRWPAHGMLWAHLVSDHSIEELHDFATRNGVPARAFDLDHYDVPESRVAALIAAGARRVNSREIVHALRDSGLRITMKERRGR